MPIDPHSVWSDLQAIKHQSPLIHNITNYVVMEPSANSLLAIGASPVMAHAIDEVEDMTRASKALVVNIGTLSPPWVKAMELSIKAAHQHNIPIVFDPVGVGATPYRTATAALLLNQAPITVIRGNTSEIMALAGSLQPSKGVDSVLETLDYREQAKSFALKLKTVIWMSGQTDVITNGHQTLLVHNGHSLMRKVTGMGCSASSLTGAFLAVNKDSLKAASHAAVTMGVAGELAARIKEAPGTYRWAFTDTLYELSLEIIQEHIRIE